jgi:hypothetical protein
MFHLQIHKFIHPYYHRLSLQETIQSYHLFLQCYLIAFHHQYFITSLYHFRGQFLHPLLIFDDFSILQ